MQWSTTYQMHIYYTLLLIVLYSIGVRVEGCCDHKDESTINQSTAASSDISKICA